MRWYWVLCFVASRLKNSTLRLLSARVTFTPSSRKTRSSGAGRKSGTTLGLPKGSSVYLVFALIDPFTLSPLGPCYAIARYLAICRYGPVRDPLARPSQPTHRRWPPRTREPACPVERVRGPTRVHGHCRSPKGTPPRAKSQPHGNATDSPPKCAIA